MTTVAPSTNNSTINEEQVSPPRPRKPRKRGSRTPLILAVIAILCIGAFIWYRVQNANNNAAPIITGTVTRGELVETVDATGNVNAQTGAEINIGSQISGTVTRLYADVGTVIKAGQLIAVLSAPDLEANVKQAEANVGVAQAKLAQDESGLGQTHTQSVMGVEQAQSIIESDKAKVAAAQASLTQQQVQTPSDISRAQATLQGAQAALASAQATYQQTVAGTQETIETAQQQLASAVATAKNSSLNLGRQQTLLAKGYVAPSVVDQAQATAGVDQAAVATAQQNLSLTQQKSAADLETYKDAVAAAKQTVNADISAVSAAQAERNLLVVDQQNVKDAQATLSHDQQALQIAIANMANDPIKQQLVQQDRSSVAAAQQQVAYDQALFSKTEIRSPIGGTVITLAIQQGETVAAGLSAPTLITVCDLNKLQVDAFPDETDIAKIKLKQNANIHVDAYPNHAIKGKVAKVSAGATIQQGIVTYDVTLAIKDRKHVLRPSMTCDCKIEVGDHKNVLLVPAVALHVSTRTTTLDVVTISNGKQVIKTVPVVTGGTDGINTEIVSGVNAGDTIVLAGGTNTTKGGGRGPSNPFGPQSGKKSSS